MQERSKMNRTDRAKQFAPFDALKGLQEALRIKELNHERVQKGDLSEEKAEEMSKIIINLNKREKVKITYFKEGYYKQAQGQIKIDIEKNRIEIDGLKIDLQDIFEIEKLNS